MPQIYTRAEIVNLVTSRDDAVERGILALYRLQTQPERTIQQAITVNGEGFSASDAKQGTLYARWILNGNHLAGDSVAHARKIVLRYVGQLTRIANARSIQKLPFGG